LPPARCPPRGATSRCSQAAQRASKRSCDAGGAGGRLTGLMRRFSCTSSMPILASAFYLRRLISSAIQTAMQGSQQSARQPRQPRQPCQPCQPRPPQVQHMAGPSAQLVEGACCVRGTHALQQWGLCAAVVAGRVHGDLPPRARLLARSLRLARTGGLTLCVDPAAPSGTLLLKRVHAACIPACVPFHRTAARAQTQRDRAQTAPTAERCSCGAFGPA
jgi:hypothetical protein